jgi:RNA polymerase sigma-70 factor (ECF subfamily)
MGGVERYALPALKASVRMAGNPMMAGSAADADDGGRAERFKALALPHLDEIYTLARYLLRGANDADDAVQECYLRAFRHFDSFRGGPIKPWLLAILRNVCHATYAGNTRLVYTADAGGELANLPAKPIWREDAETPEQTVLRRHESETMRRLIADLPAEFREVIVLREINDLSYRDIATVIEAPIGTVMSRLARARKMLREAWIAAEAGSEGQ